MDRDELKQVVSESIDENFVCHAEEHCRKLEHQLDRIETQQRHLKNYVEDHLDPGIIEIRDALREQGDKHENN
jgi:hypothetical protein